MFNVLFLCTGNSARSIMAEVAMNHPTIGGGKFRAFSAGSHPKGEVHPMALELLRDSRLSTAGLRSKSWTEFSGPGAPQLDFVFTVCDQAAQEVCPVWPGQPMTAHWGIPDPAAVEGSDADKRRAFRDSFQRAVQTDWALCQLATRQTDRPRTPGASAPDRQGVIAPFRRRDASVPYGLSRLVRAVNRSRRSRRGPVLLPTPADASQGRARLHT